ncbi:MAG TPA: OB-fold domain-containing protein [Candidatus Binatia bacterium]|nr:OB-fold domain-containing protein [Candidatus Binatia bacterium]
MADARDLPERHLPDPDWPVARPFWDGCRAGELRFPRCRDCGRWVWYPAAACPGCGGPNHDWTRVGGRGRVFTWVRVHRAFLPGYEGRVPFVTALVELAEDPALRLATFLRDVPPAGPHVGMPVEVTFERVDDRITLPLFRCIA